MPRRGSTNPTVNPVRRQSLRLKVISTIYQAEEALSSQVQQPSGGSSPCNSNQIKVQSTGFPDDPSINETLKDLRKRCRSKRQKEMKSIASSTTGLEHRLLKPKEEELDLEEPLIYLKVKSNKSCTSRKRRKHSHLSESILLVEDTRAQTPYPSLSSEVFSPSPVATDKSSTVTEVATVDGSNCIAESVDANLAVTSDEDPFHFGSPDLVYAVKTEIVEGCDAVISSSVFVGNCNTFGGSSTELSQQICEEELADGESYCCSTSKFLHPCVTSQTELGCHNFSPAVSQTGTSLLADISQSVNEVKSGVIDIDSLGEAAAYVSSSSDPACIGKFSDPGNSSGQQHERFDEGVLERGDVSSFTTETLDCCSNEVSFEFMEADSCINLPESGCLKKNLPERGELLDCKDDVCTEFMEADNCSSIPERGEENCGEMIELYSSKSSCNKLSPSSKSESPTLYADSSQLISATTDLISDVYGGASRFNITMEVVDKLTNQIDNLVRTDYHEWKSENNTLGVKMSKESENGGDEIPAPVIPTCSHENNVTTEHSLLSRDIHDLHHASVFSGDVGSLDSLVLKALSGDAQRNSNEDRLNSMSFSSSCNSHAGNVSSPGTDSLHSSTVDQALNQYIERASSFGEIDAEELINSQIEKSSLVGMCDPCVPEHSHASVDSVQQLHAAGESSPETRSAHCSTMDQMSNSCSEKEANSAENDTADIVEALDSHSPEVSPPDSGAVDELLKVEDCPSKACHENQSSAEKMLCTQVDMQTSFSPEMSNLVEGEGCNMENELKCARGMTAEHPPKKLLSNRKEFSPTSQEKLCQALNVSELDDMLKTPYKEETEVRLSSGKLTKKSKSSKNGSLQPLSKGILKSPDTSDRNPSCTENSLIHMQAQKAVTFSQRQMQDIESIATKLLKGLSSMKNIVTESTGSEELRAEEIRIAIDDASNLEATTKKWLSMMAKDCSRFCKIMHKSTENKGALPAAVRKQPKKITFADEAGGLLCHVKVFEQLPTCFIVPRNDS